MGRWDKEAEKRNPVYIASQAERIRGGNFWRVGPQVEADGMMRGNEDFMRNLI